MSHHRQLPGALLLAASLALAPGAAAQTSRADPTDFQTWYTIGVNLDLPNRWELSLKHRARLVDDSREYGGSYLYTEAERKLGDYLEALGEYRLALVDDGTYHRFGAGLQGYLEMGATELSLRPLFQFQRQSFADDADGTDDDVYLRTRLKAKHALTGRLELFASVEPFLKLGEESALDNVRNTLGAQLEYADDRKVELFYMYRPDYSRSYHRAFHVVGLSLDFDFELPARGEK